MYPALHHHGADGECHPGPGGMFGCVICERDRDDEDDGDSDQSEDHPFRTGVS